MRRLVWLGPAMLVFAAWTLLAQAPGPAVVDPAKQWQRRSQKAVVQYDGALSTSARKASLEWEVAGEERRIALLHAAHERATQLWLATEAYRVSAKDPAARQAYVQAAGAAYQQYAQAIGQAHSAWAQSAGQTQQVWSQEGGQQLQAVQTDLSAAWQSFAQAMPGYDKDGDGLTWEECQLPDAPGGDERAAADKAYGEAVNQARTRYRAALQAATAAWQMATRQTTQQHRARQLAEELASSQLRKANRLWLTTMLDAVADLRASFRSAVRKYEVATMPD